MRPLIQIFALCFSCALLSACLASKPNVDTQGVVDPNSQLGWEWLTAISGIYTTEDEAGGLSQVEYQSISRGSALMEVWGEPESGLELSVFYLDNGKLVATHYCASGIQATLLATVDAANRSIVFNLRSAANLNLPDQTHNSSFAYYFEDDGSIRRTETWRLAGGEQTYAMTLQPLTR